MRWRSRSRFASASDSCTCSSALLALADFESSSTSMCSSRLILVCALSMRSARSTSRCSSRLRTCSSCRRRRRPGTVSSPPSPCSRKLMPVGFSERRRTMASAFSSSAASMSSPYRDAKELGTVCSSAWPASPSRTLSRSASSSRTAASFSLMRSLAFFCSCESAVWYVCAVSRRCVSCSFCWRSRSSAASRRRMRSWFS
mmetsp:Transcript_13295/g.39545  ORF Transcript_13295/g.39545 Transcript_13295/m.39545 type:complete len:200 (+) Transcript_13295:2281-2880(+)